MRQRPARKSLTGFCAGLLFFLAAGGVFASGGGNSCIDCHQIVPGVNYLKHDFTDWKQSVHAKAGVTCEACHGGNPSAQDAPGAHKGLKPSTDKSSPVYFTRIPETCGTCHAAEYKAFQKSAHYEELERSGRGPNCVTCHGSMANHILAPIDLDESCSLCHKQPTHAFATIMALDNASNSVARLAKALEEARAKGIPTASQDQVYQDVKNLDAKTRVDWHTFKMPQVLAASQKITQRVTIAINELKLKEQQKKP
jgi:formate-dependent nitrite reductase cytochrome c552 subunit